MMAEFKRIRKFTAGPHAGFNNDDAQCYGDYLERTVGLGRRVVSAEEIVAAAIPDESPIHEQICGESDGEAIYERRLDLSRHLMRCIIVTTMVDDEPVESKAYHHVVTVSGKSGYISERRVWKEPQLAEQVVAQALQELRAWRSRYVEYVELAGVIASIDEAVAA